MSRRIKGRGIIFGFTTMIMLLFSSVLIIEFGVVPFFITAFLLTILGIRSAVSSGWIKKRKLIQHPTRIQHTDRLSIVGTSSRASMVCRIIMDPVDETRYTISGHTDMTFREACLLDWPFRDIDLESNWMILNESEEDITDRELLAYDGIAWIRQK